MSFVEELKERIKYGKDAPNSFSGTSARLSMGVFLLERAPALLEVLEAAEEFKDAHTVRLAHPAICKRCDIDHMNYCDDYYDELLMAEVRAYERFVAALSALDKE